MLFFPQSEFWLSNTFSMGNGTNDLELMRADKKPAVIVGLGKETHFGTSKQNLCFCSH